MSAAQLVRDAETFDAMAQQIREVGGSFESTLGRRLALIVDSRLRALETTIMECRDELRERAKQ